MGERKELYKNELDHRLGLRDKRIEKLEVILQEFYKHKISKAKWTIDCVNSKENTMQKMTESIENDVIFYRKQLERLEKLDPKKEERPRTSEERIEYASKCKHYVGHYDCIKPHDFFKFREDGTRTCLLAGQYPASCYDPKKTEKKEESKNPYHRKI